MAIYVYCIIENAGPLRLRVKGIDHRHAIYTVSHDGISAVVSEVPLGQFSEEGITEHLKDMKWVESKARAHETVIERVMQSRTVIPMKFCTIFKTEEGVKAMLGELHQEFKTTLYKLKGKEEWGVKVYSDPEILSQQIARSNQGLMDFDREIGSSPTGKAYLLRKKRDEWLAEELSQKRSQYSEEGFRRLEPLSCESRINRLLPKEVTEKKDEMILNAAYLMEKGKVRSFLSDVESLKKEYTRQGITFECTGPWPPYNFCTFMEKINAP